MITVENEDNIPLSAQFIHNHKYILLGSPVGRVKIIGLPYRHDERISVTLPHGGMFVYLKVKSNRDSRAIGICQAPTPSKV